uniref:Uncharacterized protein LOC114337989 n=1 Tax=Diabrotica virgifera virgifera TaxID=50390 RepID=A0A6P7G5P7_DIAVI
MKNEWTKERQDLIEENELYKKENKKITEDIKELQRTIEIMDKDKRKNNLIISGLEIDTDDSATLKEIATNMIGKHLGVNINIKRACKIGIRTCLIELGNETEKTAILRNRNKLKNVEPKKIWITEDLTKKEREKMKSLRDKAREMRDKGKTVKIGYNKITVDGKEWRWNYNEEKVVSPKN